MQLVRQAFPDRPAYDTAVSRAILERVARGELPETFRLARPGAMVAFGKQDVNSPGYTDAVTAAYAGRFRGGPAPRRRARRRLPREHDRVRVGGPGAGHVVRHARPLPHDRRHRGAGSPAPRRGRAHRRDPARVLPGRVQHQRAAAQTKLVGIGQRLIKGAWHIGGVIVVSRGRARPRRPDPRVRGAGPRVGPGHRGRGRRRGPGRRLGGRGGGAPAPSSPTTSRQARPATRRSPLGAST